MTVRLGHVAIAVRSIADASRLFTDVLGLSLSEIEEVPGHGVRVAFVETGGCRIEFLEPLGPDGPVAKFLATRGPGIHHIALECRDVSQLIPRLAAAGVETTTPFPTRGAGGRDVLFVRPSSAGGSLVELVSDGRDPDGRGPRRSGGQ